MQQWLGRCGRKFPWFPELPDEDPLNNEMEDRRYYLMWTGYQLYTVTKYDKVQLLATYLTDEVEKNIRSMDWTIIEPEQWAIDIWNDYLKEKGKRCQLNF